MVRENGSRKTGNAFEISKYVPTVTVYQAVGFLMPIFMTN